MSVYKSILVTSEMIYMSMCVAPTECSLTCLGTPIAF